MEESFIVGSVRTAVGKMGGTLKHITADYLAEQVIREVLARHGSDVEVDEVILGQAKQSADQSNLARVALLRADLSVSTTGYTVHRQCGSGLQAINNADMQLKLGLANAVIAGGAESMSTAPFYLRHARYGYRAGRGLLLDPNTESQPGSQPIEEYGDLTMGMTAENLAEKYRISREEQDEFAHRSQELADRAIKEGRFQQQVVPYEVKERKRKLVFDRDEHPRLSSKEKLATLPAVFKEGGTVTPGNASGRNDGAAALLMMNKRTMDVHGLKPKARILAQAVSGVSPDIMGIGPVESTAKALKQAGLQMKDIGLIELNEAFAAQSIAVIREADMPMERVNVNGGAIALGHPIGATGAVIMTKLLHEMERTGERYGLATLCIGGGQGISTVIEYLH
ncbi:acetyl-CoA acetyltransferase [Virgibacillus sp. CM-4]|uniref:acetyl-CoA C-acetyltransferase n=1 Tax=Virgibacillus massiliensis TaxID=1462526 RepID=A0A024Q9A8_9BACI|nr:MULTISPECIES: thiolase family protein [Virgibacillus]EQB38003.1 acetyl-CoA acetyltransferase [Virgibacillus sp. CM-4]CDQ38486.1 Acetyl-CoA acetyltransferase [Virgibacillus massiliensis]